MIDNTNVRTLFENRKSIRIPPYQRAYSWKIKQWKQFIGDLNEQKPDKKYHFGQFIFEISDNGQLFVVDGQQRLMTTVLFFAALAKTKKAKNIDCTSLELYLSDTMHAIDNDDKVLSGLKNGVSVLQGSVTHSQKQMVEAFVFFEKTLSKNDGIKLESLQNVLENAVVGVFPIESRLEATQVFEYQNSRGIKATEFELVKAFLMHQVYLDSTNVNSANENIKSIQKTVTETYRCIESVEDYFEEDYLMDRYCWLKYSCYGTLESIKKITTGIDESDTEGESEEVLEIKIKSIKDVKFFFDGFLELCQAAQKIVNLAETNPSVANLFLLPVDLYWDYLVFAVWIKAKPTNTNTLFKLIEFASFQIMIVSLDSKKNKRNFLYDWAFKFYNDEITIDNLIDELRKFIKKGDCPDGKKWPKLDHLIKLYKDEWYHYSNSLSGATKYILWQYENALREKVSRPKLLKKQDYDKLTLEHILAQKSNDKENTQNFQERFMNRIGNLSLLSARDNTSLSNSSFDNKKSTYEKLVKNNEIIQYKEIIDKSNWRPTEVKNRQTEICSFIDKYFNPTGK